MDTTGMHFDGGVIVSETLHVVVELDIKDGDNVLLTMYAQEDEYITPPISLMEDYNSNIIHQIKLLYFGRNDTPREESNEDYTEYRARIAKYYSDKCDELIEQRRDRGWRTVVTGALHKSTAYLNARFGDKSAYQVPSSLREDVIKVMNEKFPLKHQ